MTNIQFYFAIGMPTFAVLMGIIAGLYQTAQLNARFTSLEARFGKVEDRLDSRMSALEGRLDTRMSGLEGRLDARMSVIESDIKTLVRITGDMDTRIARLEERTAH